MKTRKALVMLILVMTGLIHPASQMTSLAQQDDFPVFPYITYGEIPQYWYLTNEIEGWYFEFVSYGPLDYQKPGDDNSIIVQISVNGFQERKEDFLEREDIVAFTQNWVDRGSSGWDIRKFIGRDAYHIESITQYSATSQYSVLLDRIDPSDWNNYYEVSYWIKVLSPNEDYDWKVARVNELLSQVKINIPEDPAIIPPWIKRVPLCQEARAFFLKSYLEKAGFKTAEDMENTSLMMDDVDLMKQFLDAVVLYNKTPGEEVFASPNVFGSIPASTWLATEAGLVDAVNRQFVYYSGKPDRGTEPAMREAIVNFYDQNKNRKLTPGDVFYLALQQRKGDAKAALLLAHNTLRTLSRPDENSTDPQYLEKLIGLKYDPNFVNQYLEPMRTFKGDNAGPWYHMFGTAYFSMETQGDWGPMAVLMYMEPDVGAKAYSLKYGLQLIMQTTGLKSTDQEFWSQVANWFEQYVRWTKNSVPDPEKFCVNIWGAKIGVALYESLPAVKTKPPLGTTTTMTILGPINLPDPHILVDGSPVVLTVEGNGYKMVVDQVAGNIYGYYPIMLLPILEQDGTWGMGWMNQDDRLYKITFEAIADGTLHFADLDTELQQLAYYETPIKVGDTYSLIFDASMPPTPLVAPDGSVIEPVISTVDTSAITKLLEEDQDITTDIGSLPSGGETPQILGDYGDNDQDSILPWIAAAGGFIAVVTGALILKARKKTQKPTTGAQKTPAARHADTSRRPGLGTSSNVKKAGPSEDRHVCPSCGQPVRAGAAFCRNCGNKIK